MRRWDPPPMASKRAPARPPALVRARPIGPDGTRTPAPASASHASARQRLSASPVHQRHTSASARPVAAPHERERERPPLIVRPDTSARPLSLSAFSPGTIRLRIPSACARIIARQSVRNIERR